MNRILLGSYELTDSNKLRLECDFYIPKFSHFPDLIIEFKDELIPSTQKLAKDPAVLEGLLSFLKTVGYPDAKFERLVAEPNSLVAETDAEFLPFAAYKGWLDLTQNSAQAKKASLLSILDDGEAPGFINTINDDYFNTGGKDFLVLEFERVTDLVRKGTLENLAAFDSGVLAGHTSRRLSDSYEDRKVLIDKKKEELSKQDFNEWLKQYLAADDSFFVHVVQSLPKDDVYKIALNGRIAGHTENHIIFEVEI